MSGQKCLTSVIRGHATHVTSCMWPPEFTKRIIFVGVRSNWASGAVASLITATEFSRTLSAGCSFPLDLSGRHASGKPV